MAKGKQQKAEFREGAPSIVVAAGLQTILGGIQMATTILELTQKGMATGVTRAGGKKEPTAEDKNNLTEMLRVLTSMAGIVKALQTAYEELFPDRFAYMLKTTMPAIEELFEQIDEAATAWENGKAGKRKGNGAKVH